MEKIMFEDRVILVENMDSVEATKLIKSLPSKTNEDNRHKFVFNTARELVIGNADLGNPKHSELGSLSKDKIAGYICFIIDEKDVVTNVYMNNKSKDFNYPKFELLKEPQIFITKLFGPICVDMEDIPKPKSRIIDLSNLTTH